MPLIHLLTPIYELPGLQDESTYVLVSCPRGSTGGMEKFRSES